MPRLAILLGDAMAAQMRSASCVLIAFVCMQLRWPAASPAAQPSDGWQRIDALLEHCGVVPVCTTDQNHQWDATRVYNDVPFGYELAAIRRIGPCFLAHQRSRWEIRPLAACVAVAVDMGAPAPDSSNRALSLAQSEELDMAAWWRRISEGYFSCDDISPDLCMMPP